MKRICSVMLACVLMFTATSVSALTEYVYNADGQLDYQYNYKSNTKVDYKRNDNGSLINKVVKDNAVVPVQNRLVDGQFEHFQKGNKGWVIQNSKADVKPFTKWEDGGLSIQCSELALHSFCGVSQTITVQPNQPFVYQAVLDIHQLVGVHAQMYVDFYDKQGKWVGAHIKDIHEDNGIPMYTTYSTSGLVPVAAEKATAYLLIRSDSANGSGSLDVTSASFQYGKNNNLIYNGHLQISNGYNLSEAWTRHTGGPQNTVYERKKDQHNDIQEIKVSQLSGGAMGGIAQLIEVEPNKKFKVAGNFLISELNGAHVQLYVDFLDKNGVFVGANVTPYHSTTVGHWINLVNHGTVPANAVSARVYALVRGDKDNSAGTIQVDNITFSYDENDTTVNGDFNAYYIDDHIAAHWKSALSVAQDKRYQLVNDGKGGVSQFVKGNRIQSGGYVGILQTFKVNPQRHFEADANLKIHELKDAKVQLYIDFFNAEGKYMQTNAKELNAVTGAQSVKVSASGEVPDGATHASVYILIRGNNNDAGGAITVENVQFTYK
ncbi:hypothetical protein [Paenibacillus assamensis]|uniref:hypothetical protein n=1 Tax=Paenibacillus assamensis TaxID=311244 RepID=UPI0003FC5CB6|nr:hypothetical protein [Paenibacillus assamensis]